MKLSNNYNKKWRYYEELVAFSMCDLNPHRKLEFAESLDGINLDKILISE